MAQVSLYRNGYSLIHKARNVCHSGGGKRGKLTGKYSSASFRRLRKWCITHDVDADCFGLTLTVPGLELLPISDFKKLHHLLCVFCNDRSFPFVWRVELQKRGMPHIHGVVFSTIESAFSIISHWYHLLDSLPDVLSVESITPRVDDICEISRAFVRGSRYACDLQKLSGDFRAWRYLVAHMSKSKQSQLGWAGRNWGVCNRSLFNDVDASIIDLPDQVFYRVRRWVRRLTRRRSFCGTSYYLGNPDTIKAMIQYVNLDEQVPF